MEHNMRIQEEMTILDVVSKYRQTEAVFKRYDEKAGICLCCQALFEPLKDVADKYRPDERNQGLNRGSAG